jgi:hypothetical protein
MVNNINSSVESADAEPIELTKANAVNTYQTRGRGVNSGDYEYLIGNYIEDNKINPKLVQAYKDETEPDLINELLIYVLGVDPDTGRYAQVDIDLTESGGLYEYVYNFKNIPEGILTEAGTNGFNDGTIVDAVIYFNVEVYDGYQAELETIREKLADAIKEYFHALDFQETVSISRLHSACIAVEGIKSVGIFTDPSTQDQSTSAYDMEISGHANRGKVYAMPEAFYNNIKSYIKFITESSYS